jgi:protein ImuA
MNKLPAHEVGALRRSALDLEPAHPGVTLGAPSVEAALGGLRLGALHEVFAQDTAAAGSASGFVMGLAARASPKKRLLWVRQDFAAQDQGALAALGLLALGMDPSRIILVKAPDALAVLRAMQEALSCSGLGAVVAELYGTPKLLDLTASRRLGLAAAKKGVTGFLLRHPAPFLPSAAETRWVVASAPSIPAAESGAWGWPRFAVTLLRNRHGRTGYWVLSWKDGLFHDETAHSRFVASPPADRPPAPPQGAGFALGAGGEKQQRLASDGARREGGAARPQRRHEAG